MVVIFDWDGTLYDSRDALVNAWTRTGKKFGLKLSEEAIIRCMALTSRSSQR